MSSLHLLLGRPLDLFPFLGCHSEHLSVWLTCTKLNTYLPLPTACLLASVYHTSAFSSRKFLVPLSTSAQASCKLVAMFAMLANLPARLTRGRYHGGRRPSSDDSLHSPTGIPPSALDKPSIMKPHHHRQTCSHTSPRLSPTMVTLHDTQFVECRW